MNRGRQSSSLPVTGDNGSHADNRLPTETATIADVADQPGRLRYAPKFDQENARMHPLDIVVKTERGVAEIGARTLNLAPKVRRLLIMIDSSRTVGELEQIFAPLGDVREMLGELAMQRLIAFRPSRAAAAGGAEGYAPSPTSPAAPPERRAEARMPPYEAAPEREPARTTFYAQRSGAAATARVAAFPTGLPVDSSPAPGPVRSGEIGALKSQVRAFLTSVLGSDESLIDAKLDAVADHGQLAAFLAGCEGVLANYGGVRMAKEFRSRFGAHYS